MPLNYGEFKTPIGVVETQKKEQTLLVSYGSTLRLVQQAANELLEVGMIVRLSTYNHCPI
jgi:hypothetical protein